MNWKPAIELALLQQKERETVVIEGKKILLIWHNEQIHAVQAQCPHFKFSLAKGVITEECAIICPLHKSKFDLETGEVQAWSPWPPVVGPLLGKAVAPKNLKIYPTRVEGDKIFVDLDESCPITESMTA
jgi:nitrite reductase/ring-hydroxylating ferredoxin subunit